MLLTGLPLVGYAQSVATAPASSGLYDLLESVSARFPRRGVFLGERSLSMRQLEAEVDRLNNAIDSAAPDAGRDWAHRELMEVAGALRSSRGVIRQGRTTLFVGWRADLSSTNAVSERFVTNGLGTIDAISSPFDARRYGWPLAKGAVLGGAPTAVLTVRDGFALAIEPRVSQLAPENGAPSTELRLHRAYARAVVHNVAVRLGADEMHWGQSPLGALFISRNAAPIPALAVGTDTGITLPWVFRLAGPTRATAFLADLGAAQDPSHAKLAGWQVSIEPWSRFELGVAVLAQTGGNGGPKATFLQRVVDLFPVIDAVSPQRSDLQISNKLAGGNLRLRIPELSGLDLYYELQLDDFDVRRLRSSLVEDAAHLLGARLPVLISGGQLTWRAEWHHTSLRLYEHAQFKSGVTYRDRIIGSPLGPNATGAYLSASWRTSSRAQVEVALADEARDPSQYLTTSNNARDEGFRFVRLTDDPDFRRRRVIVSWDGSLGAGAVRLIAGYNRSWRVGSSFRNEWLGELAIRSHALPVF